MQLFNRKPRRAGKVTALLLILAGAALALGGCGGGGGGGTSPSGQATLNITSTPSGAAIYINGSNTGQRTPATIRRSVAAAGTDLQVRVTLSGYEDGVSTITALPNQTVPLDFTLVTSNPPSIPPYTITGTVSLVSGSGTVPATNATVTATNTTTHESFAATMDTAAGRTGVYYLLLPAGTYTVTASRSGYQNQSRQLTVYSTDDRQTGINFTLPPG